MTANIVIVEDEPVLLMGMLRGLAKSETLTLCGHPSAEAALDDLARSTPDVLITDINLPGRSGLELIGEIQQRAPNTAVIVTTAYRISHAPQLASLDGITILEKPVDLDALRRVVDEKIAAGPGAGRNPFQLTDFIQLAGMGGHSVAIRCRLPGGEPCQVDIYKGEIWAASAGRHQAMDAILRLVSEAVTDLSYETLAQPPAHRQITDRWEAVLMEAARLHDEAGRSPSENPTTAARGDPAPRSGHSSEERSDMAQTQEICQKVVADVQDCLAVGVVDLNTGMLMGVHHTVPYFTQTYLDAVAAAAVDMFRGKNVRRVEELLSKQRGTEIRDSFAEVFVSSIQVFHFMKIIPDKEAVVVMVTKKTANQGMGWAAVRAALDDIKASLP